MSFSRALLVAAVVVVILCVVIDAHRGRGWGRGRGMFHKTNTDLMRYACKLEVAGQLRRNRNCFFGFRNSTCTWGPMVFENDKNETVSATFCTTTPAWNRPNPYRSFRAGVLKEACKIEVGTIAVNGTRPCRKTGTCDMGPLDITLNSTATQVFFCDYPPPPPRRRGFFPRG